MNGWTVRNVKKIALNFVRKNKKEIDLDNNHLVNLLMKIYKYLIFF